MFWSSAHAMQQPEEGGTGTTGTVAVGGADHGRSPGLTLLASCQQPNTRTAEAVARAGAAPQSEMGSGHEPARRGAGLAPGCLSACCGCFCALQAATHGGLPGGGWGGYFRTGRVVWELGPAAHDMTAAVTICRVGGRAVATTGKETTARVKKWW